MIFLSILQIVCSEIVIVNEEVEGQGAIMLQKSMIYSKGEIYGDNSPYIKLECNEHAGTPLAVKGYLGVLKYSEFMILKSKFSCEKSEKLMVSLSQSNFLQNISETDIYVTVLTLCEKSKFNLNLTITTLNPYGYLPGDLFYLIPFYLLSASLYTFFLLLWLLRLCCYFSYSIPLQRLWIPAMLAFCISESLLEFYHWSNYNSTGHNSILTISLSVIIKSSKDSIARILLLGAGKGWGITRETTESNRMIYLLGFLYFLFDLIYLSMLKSTGLDLFLLLITGFPLVFLNTLIFFLIFSWFSKTFYKLNFNKQTYKLHLLKRFALALGVAGLISLIWVVLEVLLRFFWKESQNWYGWIYVASWEIIFMAVVATFMTVWRVTKSSKLLEATQEVYGDDISHEEEEQKYGIELGSIK